MDKKIKNALIVISGIIFILIIPLTLLYCFGYRFDFESKKIIETGGFSFKTHPKNCEVYLNDNFIKKTDFVFGEIFIKNLLPKKYNIKIKKQGFQDWEKNLEVKEKIVTEAKKIILFPEKPDFLILQKDIDDYFLSPDENKLILKKFDETGWELSLFNLENKEKSSILKNSDLKEKEALILEIKWSFDSKKILLKIETKKGIEYFIADTLKENQKYIFSLDNLGKIREISFNNQNSQEIFFLKTTSTKNNLYKTNYYQTSSPDLILENALSYLFSGGDIFYLDNEGFLKKSNLSGNNLTILNKKPFPVKKESEYEIKIPRNQKMFINGEEGFYFLDPESLVFEKISDSINNLGSSPDSKNIYFFNNHEIWLSDESFEEIVFLNRFSKKLGDVFWLNSDYLIFHTEEKIQISEIDNRDKINMAELGSFENSKIFWNKNYKILYVLSKGNLYYLENLIP